MLSKIKKWDFNYMSEEIIGWILDKSIAPTAHLTQGDLIRFVDQTEPLRMVGIVVTADCDLEQKKHAKLVTLIPVVSVKILMENYLLPEDCEKKRAQIESYAFREFGIASDLELDARKAVLKGVMDGIPFEPEMAKSIAAKFATDQLNVISVAQYKTLMTAINLGPKKSSDLSKQIDSRGDLLILPSPIQLGIEGDVAWVRHIWQESLGDIAIRTSEVKSKAGERIARLDSPFRYRLTQLLAQVFSDIGLPDINSLIEQKIQDAYENA